MEKVHIGSIRRIWAEVDDFSVIFFVHANDNRTLQRNRWIIEKKIGWCFMIMERKERKKITSESAGLKQMLLLFPKLFLLCRTLNRKHIHITSSVFRSLYSWHAWCSTSTFYLIFYENGSRCYRNERPFHKLHILPWFCTSLHILSWWCRTCPHILQVKPV